MVSLGHVPLQPLIFGQTKPAPGVQATVVGRRTRPATHADEGDLRAGVADVATAASLGNQREFRLIDNAGMFDVGVVGRANREGRRMAFALIRDAIESLTTPFPRHLRDMGHVHELRQLAARATRCCAAWRPHLERSRSLILEAADRCVRNDKALIVGSGLLFDIPITELTRRLREVVLVDILHLWQVRRAVRSYSNVRLEQVESLPPCARSCGRGRTPSSFRLRRRR